MSGSDFQRYEVTESNEVEQGDFIPQCPVFIYPPEAAERGWNGDLLRSFNDVMVLTQSCDLVIDRKRGKPGVEFVVVCPVYTKTALDQAGHPSFSSRDKWNLVIKELVVGWRALEACDLSGFQRQLSAIDLRTFYTVPFSIIDRLAAGKRLRLLPPYRENVAQAFAQQFTRVALPKDIARL